MNLPHLNVKTRFLAAALIFSITLGPSARAGGTVIEVRRHVSSAGLNLATEDGARRMYLRLKGAARALCQTQDPVKMAPSWVYRECMERALAGAIVSVSRPLVTQAFINDYGGDASGLLISKSYQADLNPVKTLGQRIDP